MAEERVVDIDFLDAGPMNSLGELYDPASVEDSGWSDRPLRQL